MKLGPNFSLSEFTRSGTASRRGIRNDPPAAVIDRLVGLVEAVLQPVRDHFGRPVVVTSGYRCPELNEAVGSAGSSQHTTGEAADFTVSGVPNPEVARWIERNCRFDQLILEFPERAGGGWIHCSVVPRSRGAVMTANRTPGGTRYAPGIRG